MDSGARGCLIIISGKLTGERHRTEKFKEGYIKYCGETRNLQFIRTGFAVAKLKPGVIGVKVEIMDPDARLPAEIDVLNLEQAKTALPDMVELLTPGDTLIDRHRSLWTNPERNPTWMTRRRCPARWR